MGRSLLVQLGGFLFRFHVFGTSNSFRQVYHNPLYDLIATAFATEETKSGRRVEH